MASTFGFASRLCGCLAGLFAVLALLVSSSRARADDYSDCLSFCSGQGLSGQEFSLCMGQCMNEAKEQCNHQVCSKNCDTSVFPMCGNGACNKSATNCVKDCMCYLFYIAGKARFCECQVQ